MVGVGVHASVSLRVHKSLISPYIIYVGGMYNIWTLFSFRNVTLIFILFYFFFIHFILSFARVLNDLISKGKRKKYIYIRKKNSQS